MGDLGLSRRRLLFTTAPGLLGIAVLTGCSSSSPPSPAPTTEDTPVPAASGAVAGDWRRVAMAEVSAYILVRGKETAIVDLGLPGSIGAIEAALKEAGAGWGSVKHVILTHLHQDHVGGLPDVGPKVNAAIYAGAGDAASIISEKPLKPVREGDEIFGLQVIDTPGHTLGHISMFEPATGILVAGDALRTSGGLAGSAPEFTADQVKADASVRKLAALDVKAILCGHGTPLTAGAGPALKELAAGLK
jgi:glyoxylase-like metal-dependent hydrolase (beta-lactamase superfamily II)